MSQTYQREKSYSTLINIYNHTLLQMSHTCTYVSNWINPRLPEHFLQHVFLRGWLPPPVNLKLTPPKYVCLVSWYRTGSLLFIDTKIIKIGQRMTSQWRNKTWPTWKCRFSAKHRPILIFFTKKVLNIGISPGFLLIKNGNGVSSTFCKC